MWGHACISKMVIQICSRISKMKISTPISASIRFLWIVRNESLNQFITLCMWGHACISKMGIQICSRIFKPKSLALDIRIRSFFTDHPKWGPNSIRHFVHLGPRLHLQNGYPNMLSDIKTEKFSLRLFLFNELSTFKMFFRHYKALLKYFENFVKYFKGFL